MNDYLCLTTMAFISLVLLMVLFTKDVNNMYIGDGDVHHSKMKFIGGGGINNSLNYHPFKNFSLTCKPRGFYTTNCANWRPY